jgi:23S rRNA (pseudouridine1915-N3)-methyltransferase
MKIKVLAIGKSNPTFMMEGVAFFTAKLKHLCDMEWRELLSKNKHEQPEKILQVESALFLKNIEPSDYVILLDERGTTFASSIQFSEYLNKKNSSGVKRIVFLIGGAFGFDPSIYERANEKISMASMTFSHQNIRLIFLEQLYRGYAILNHLPYHHE